MPYMEEICVAGDTIEINKYYAQKYHGKAEGKREKKKKKTSAAQKKVNLRKAIKLLRRLMNANFIDGDYLIRLDFAKVYFPDGSNDMQKYMTLALRELRKLFKKNQMTLKYIYVKEVGPRGGRHVHMMMSKCDLDFLCKAWPYGGIHVDPLHTHGQYRKVAEYFGKYAEKTEETEGKIIGKRWYPSRNLDKPEVKKRIISSTNFRKNIKDIEGYYLEKESTYSGISEWSGYEYFSYTLVRSRENEVRGG